MKPLTILHTESSGVLGGQEYRVLSEARSMAARGHRIILALPHDSELIPLAREADLRIEPLLINRFRYGPLCLEYFQLIRTWVPDVVNTHGSIDSWTASIAARMSPVRPIIIRTRHKSTPVSPTYRHRLLYRTLPHGVVTTGMAVRDYLLKQFRLDPEKIVSIPSGVDLSEFRMDIVPGVLRRELGMSSSQPLIGTVAFLRAYKGLEDLVAAAAIVCRAHADARFVIVGDGPERRALDRKILELGLTEKCVLTGHRNDVPQILADLDIFVQPSREGEGLPQAMTQAMAMRRPVVATPVGGIPEVIHEKVTGLLVPTREPSLLAMAIKRLLADQALREKVSQEGQRVILQGYTVEHMLEKTEAFYQSLLHC